MKIKLNIVDDNERLINKGDALVFDRKNGTQGLIIVCPNCGKASAPKSDKIIYDPKTQSCTPSLVHNKNLGGCGWHGHLKNGYFIND